MKKLTGTPGCDRICSEENAKMIASNALPKPRFLRPPHDYLLGLAYIGTGFGFLWYAVRPF
jgi:hypothetical protein